MQDFPDIARRSGSRAAPGDTGGFVLPVVLLLLMVLSTVSVFFLISGSDQQRAGRAMRESARSFYAADAGVNAVMANWDSLQYDTLLAGSGDSVDLGWTTLDEGSTYRAMIHRVDGGGDLPHYSVEVTGVGPPPLGGQRKIYLELFGVDADICCPAAVSGGANGVDLRLDSAGLGGVTVNGLDSIPAGWGPVCTEPPVNKPGSIWLDTTNVELDNSAQVFGSPPSVEDPTITTTNLFDWGAIDYDGIAAMANITFPDGTTISGGIGPLEAPPGTCKLFGVGSDYNWGDPLVPGSPCSAYFPIIHVTGDFDIDTGPNYGQGILLVDGELRIEDQFDFYGIIMVKDRSRFEDNVTIHGGLISGERVRFEDGASLQYSSCAVDRALDAVGLGGTIEALEMRSWRQAVG